MTTIAFNPVPTNAPPFQTSVTLDGNAYLLSVYWQQYAQRWYVKLTDDAGKLTWNGAMLASPLDYDILLAPGIFTTSRLLYRESTNNFEVTP